MDEFKINFDGTEIPIPTKTSQLENDSGFATQSAVESSASSTLDSANAYTDNKFNGANKAVSFVNYSSMITSLNTLSNTSYSVGQNIMIVTLEVPDLWVSEVAETSVAYTYVSDDDFVADLNTNGSVQVGYYKLSALETQKVDLTDYVKNTDYATASKVGLIKANSKQGLFISATGDLSLVQAQPTDLVNKTNVFRPLTAKNMDEALKVSMTTNTQEWSDDDKTNARNLIDAVGVNDMPTSTKAGVVKITGSNGLYVGDAGNIGINRASKSQIDGKTETYNPIVPRNLDYAVKVGMTTNQEDWTEEEKSNARTLIDAVGTTDYATTSKAGIVKPNVNYGTYVNPENGTISLVSTANNLIDAKTDGYRPITPKQLDYAVKVGVTTNTIELTDEEKASTQAWLGVPSVQRVNEVEADIPTKTSDLTNDSAFITANDIPASDVTSVNGKTGDVVLSAGDVNALPDTTKIPSKTSDLTNDSGFITGESDPTVPSWAKQASKPTYTYSEITEKPTLATVATSGNYDDLSNKPTIPDVSGKADLNNPNQTITANDIVLQGFSMFNYCADLGSKITPIKFLNGGGISSNTYLPVIDVGQMGIVSYRSTTNTTLKLYLPSSGSYDYALILGNPYHSSGGTGVSNGISGTNTAGGSHLTDIVNNSKYTAVMVLYRRVS